MSVKLFTCECESTIFFNVTPHQFEEKDINNWNTFGLKAYAGTAAILICLSCGKAHVPPANFSGKSRLDPNVVAYGELLNSVEEHNKIEESGCKCPVVEVKTGPSSPFYINQKEEDSEMAKLDKQTNPAKTVDFDKNKGSKPGPSQEPNNKSGKTVTKVKRVKKPTKKSMSENKVDGPN